MLGKECQEIDEMNPRLLATVRSSLSFIGRVRPRTYSEAPEFAACFRELYRGEDSACFKGQEPRALVYESHCPHYFQFIKSRLVLECSSNACQAKIRTPFRPPTLHLSRPHPPEGGPYTNPTTPSVKRATSPVMTLEDTYRFGNTCSGSSQ